METVQKALSPELLRPGYGGSHPLAGHCYVASEALYHLLGGKDAGWTPEQMHHQGVSHWYLREPSRRATTLIEKIRRGP